MARLSDPVTSLKGVGPARAKQLENLNIVTLGGLICHFPRGYEDRTKLVPIAQLQADAPACFRAVVMTTPRTAHIRKGMDLTKVSVADYSGRINLTFFNSKFAAETLQYGAEYIFYGMVSGDYGGYGITNPVFETPDSRPVATRRIMPIYPLTAGLNNGTLTKLIAQALAVCDPPEEILPEEIRREFDVLPAAQAYTVIHDPQTMEQAQAAKKRLIFEEFFVFSAGLSLMRAARAEKKVAPYENIDLSPFYARLPFALTGAQKRAVEEILGDFQKGAPMNRLVQGDVGSGKTMLAAYGAWLAAKNGYQCALMAPTELLAEQHYRSLAPLLEQAGLRVGLLTGAVKGKARKTVYAALESGELDLVIGTHALLSEGVTFAKLGLVVTDEQHRFGVGQRAALAAKADGTPHVLVMSATPIPRTLALIIYGDLDVSVVDELPPGRSPVETYVVGEDKRQRMYNFVRKLVGEGRQAYIVCPAVEEGETDGEDPGGSPAADLKAAVTYAQTIQTQVFPDLRVGLVHGKMKSKEKDAVMTAFAAGELDVLVSTTVIEVGVDVPNAALMIVENADRFGLSQLHQLRGRVGRGKHQSYCVLVTSTRSQDSRERLRILSKTNDGFKIAEEDLRLRGPGDFFGSRQHGLPQLGIADLAGDMRVLKEAQSAAEELLRADPGLTFPGHARLLERVKKLFSEQGDVFN